jgi:hypothetical protein
MIVVILLALVLFVWVSIARFFQHLDSRLGAFYKEGGEHDKAWTDLKPQTKTDDKKENSH